MTAGGATLRAIHERYVETYPGEAARTLEQLSLEEVREFVEAQRPEHRVATLTRMRPDVAGDLLASMRVETASDIVSELEPARAAALLARLDPEPRDRVLDGVGGALATEIRELVEYPLDTAGRLMDPRVNSFRPDETVGRVLERLRTLRGRRIQAVFLIDDTGQLVGSIPLQEIALADPDDRLDTHANRAPAQIRATASREEILEELQARRVASLPVVSFDGKLLGVIRHDALVEAAREEATADIQTMVGASKDEQALSPPLFAVRKRLPWLQINLLTAFLAASVVGLFEDTIARFTALAVLLPVVAGQSGNTGAQALAVTMRGLALREVRVRHWMQVSGKEVLAASINGVAVAATTGLGVYLWSDSLGLTLVIGISMVISMTLAGLSGAAIPMLLTALGQDPAQSSSIILTTVTDVVGFFSFLGIATMLASML